MNIAGFPTSLQEAETFFDSYEYDNIAYSPAGAQLMARPVLSAMFDDEHLTDALGLRAPVMVGDRHLKFVDFRGFRVAEGLLILPAIR